MVNVEPIESAAQQPISDDQELAKVLAGVDLQGDAQANSGVSLNDPIVTTTLPDPIAEPAVESEPIVVPPVVTPVAEEPVSLAPASTSNDLNVVKQDALNELRPLVDKLDVSPEEKFDTYLLLLRSTDDRDLIAPAHEAAKNIVDEARRAQALLDIIKEIDFLTQAQQQQ